MPSIGTVRIGISGWRYPPWRGLFYPVGLPQRRELEYASRQLPTIEINGSFYSLQRPEYYAEWHRETPDGFVFAVKGGRFITHMLKLSGVEGALANFFASGVANLKDKLGPFLWQLPPMLRYQPERIDRFLALLPRDTDEAAALAARHDAKVEGRTALDFGRCRPLRHAIEVRHESFRDPTFIASLRRHRVALVVADTAGKWPCFEDVTADFVYVRLHGDTELYVSGYGKRALERWRDRITCWRAGREPADAVRASAIAPRPRAARDVYCYFDNDAKVRAPVDAQRLIAMLAATAVGEASPRRRSQACAAIAHNLRGKR
jgi:uncharacterized protein YecE (DUF72 family)